MFFLIHKNNVILHLVVIGKLKNIGIVYLPTWGGCSSKQGLLYSTVSGTTMLVHIFCTGLQGNIKLPLPPFLIEKN